MLNFTKSCRFITVYAIWFVGSILMYYDFVSKSKPDGAENYGQVASAFLCALFFVPLALTSLWYDIPYPVALCVGTLLSCAVASKLHCEEGWPSYS